MLPLQPLSRVVLLRKSSSPVFARRLVQQGVQFSELVAIGAEIGQQPVRSSTGSRRTREPKPLAITAAHGDEVASTPAQEAARWHKQFVEVFFRQNVCRQAH